MNRIELRSVLPSEQGIDAKAALMPVLEKFGLNWTMDAIMACLHEALRERRLTDHGDPVTDMRPLGPAFEEFVEEWDLVALTPEDIA